MTDEIQPALTSEQWEHKALAPDRIGRTTHWHLWGDDLEREKDCNGYNETVSIWSEERHAIAALALHDRPYGFTHDDVALLQRAENDEAQWAYSYRGAGNGIAERHDQRAAAYRSLASRIAALLPPAP